MKPYEDIRHFEQQLVCTVTRTLNNTSSYLRKNSAMGDLANYSPNYQYTPGKDINAAEGKQKGYLPN